MFRILSAFLNFPFPYFSLSALFLLSFSFSHTHFPLHPCTFGISALPLLHLHFKATALTILLPRLNTRQKVIS